MLAQPYSPEFLIGCLGNKTLPFLKGSSTHFAQQPHTCFYRPFDRLFLAIICHQQSYFCRNLALPDTQELLLCFTSQNRVINKDIIHTSPFTTSTHLKQLWQKQRDSAFALTKVLQEGTLSSDANGEEKLTQNVILHFSKFHFILYVFWSQSLSRHSLGLLTAKSKKWILTFGDKNNVTCEL